MTPQIVQSGRPPFSVTLRERRLTSSYRVLLGVAFAAIPQVAQAQGKPELYVDTLTIQASSGVRLKAELGRLTVPLDYAHPEGQRISLAFLRFAREAGARGTPIVYLAGGPGSSGTAAIGSARGEGMLTWRSDGDVILLDQRGVGRSAPSLSCPQPFRFEEDTPADRATLTSAYQRFARACAAFWRKQGIDLTAFNTEASADDLQALADALGAPAIRLVGASYGTHLALAVMRRHPRLVQRAVLIGVEGPDHTLKRPMRIEEHLRDVSKLLAADASVGSRFSDFRAQLSDLSARLDRAPASSTLVDSVTGGRLRVRISGLDARLVAASLLGRRGALVSIPAIFGPAFEGDFGPLAAAVHSSVRNGTVSAMSAAMDCASFASPARLRIVRREAVSTSLGTLLDFPFPEWCDAWGVRPLGAMFRTAVRSDVPVLLVAGTLDGLTPLANALDVRRSLARSALLTVDGGGHDSLADAPAIGRSITEFLRTGVLRDTTVFLSPLRFRAHRGMMESR